MNEGDDSSTLPPFDRVTITFDGVHGVVIRFRPRCLLCAEPVGVGVDVIPCPTSISTDSCARSAAVLPDMGVNVTGSASHEISPEKN